MMKKLPDPFAVLNPIIRPPTSATGSILAHASSGEGKKAHSSTTTRLADSPRAGSLAEGIETICDPLSKAILCWCSTKDLGPRFIIQSGKCFAPYFVFSTTKLTLSVREVNNVLIGMKKRQPKLVSSNQRCPPNLSSFQCKRISIFCPLFESRFLSFT